jgi:hypothetical protein
MMTLDEAQKVASIIATADGGCSNWVCALIRECSQVFPKFDWVKLVVETGEFTKEELV